MSYSSRFFLYAPLALLLAIGAAAGLYWWHAESRLAARIAAMGTGEAMPGVTVRYGWSGIGGFPFRLDALFGGMRVSVETGHGPATWRAERFALHALTYGRDETIFEAAGRQSIAWTDGRGRPHRLDFEAGATHASVIRDRGGVSRIDLDLVDFGSSALTAERLQLHIRRAPGGDGVDLFASGDKLRLSPALRGAFGGEIRSMRLRATASAASAFDGLRAGRAGWRSAVDAWRGASGVLHLDPLEIDWGGLVMRGRGGLSLDGAHRPQGIVDFGIWGMADWIAQDRPAKRGGIAAALRGRAAKAGSGAGGRMGVVLGVRDGIVYLGGETAGMAPALY